MLKINQEEIILKDKVFKLNLLFKLRSILHFRMIHCTQFKESNNKNTINLFLTKYIDFQIMI